MSPNTADREVAEPPAPPLHRASRLLVHAIYCVSAAIILPYSAFVLLVERGSFSRVPVVLGVAVLCAASAFLYRAAALHFSPRLSVFRVFAAIVLLFAIGAGSIAVVSILLLSALCEGWTRFQEWRGTPRPAASVRAGLAVAALLVLCVFPWLNAMYFRGTGVSYLNFEHGRRNIFYGINEDGFRGPRVPVPRSQGPRLLFMGDSTTFGFPYRYSEAYPYLVKARLAELGLPDAEILNAGTVGQSIAQIRGQLPSILRFDPDIVFMMVGIHYRRAQQDWRNLKSRNAPRRTGFRPVFGIPILPELIRFAIPSAPLFEGRVDFSDFVPSLGDPNEPGFAIDLASFRTHLEGAIVEARRAGIAVVVIEYPTPVATREVQQEARATAARLGASFVPLFETAGDRIHTAMNDGVHPDRRGHRLIAREIGSVALEVLGR